MESLDASSKTLSLNLCDIFWAFTVGWNDAFVDEDECSQADALSSRKTPAQLADCFCAHEEEEKENQNWEIGFKRNKEREEE